MRIGTAIGAGVGALVGWIAGRNRNETLEDRIAFARRLGFVGPDREPLHQLFTVLEGIGRADLVHIARGVIGRRDHAAEEQWERNVVEALQIALAAGQIRG